MLSTDASMDAPFVPQISKNTTSLIFFMFWEGSNKIALSEKKFLSCDPTCKNWNFFEYVFDLLQNVGKCRAENHKKILRNKNLELVKNYYFSEYTKLWKLGKYLFIFI